MVGIAVLAHTYERNLALVQSCSLRNAGTLHCRCGSTNQGQSNTVMYIETYNTVKFRDMILSSRYNSYFEFMRSRVETSAWKYPLSSLKFFVYLLGFSRYFPHSVSPVIPRRFYNSVRD